MLFALSAVIINFHLQLEDIVCIGISNRLSGLTGKEDIVRVINLSESQI